MPEPTPGWVAYAAWCQRWQAYPGQSTSTVMPGPWLCLSPLQQACWEAAAQAVLTDYLEQVARLCMQAGRGGGRRE